MRRAINIEGAAQAIGPYSHCVVTDQFVFVSGQGPIDPSTGEKSSTIEGQVRQTLRNIQTILTGVGLGLSDVVKVQVFLADLADFEAFNTIYREFFPADYPARTTVGASLLDILVEIDCIAVKGA